MLKIRVRAEIVVEYSPQAFLSPVPGLLLSSINPVRKPFCNTRAPHVSRQVVGLLCLRIGKDRFSKQQTPKLRPLVKTVAFQGIKKRPDEHQEIPCSNYAHKTLMIQARKPLNPKPQVPNPKPQRAKPKNQSPKPTTNPKAINPKPQSSKPETPKVQILHPKVLNPKPLKNKN